MEGEDTNGSNEFSQFPDTRFGRDGLALRLWLGDHRRVGSLIGSVEHICPCPRRWSRLRRRWFPRRWLPRRRIPWSRRGIWARVGAGPLSLWLLRRILSLLRRRGRLLFSSATRHDALRLANTPRLGLRVIAIPPGLSAPR